MKRFNAVISALAAFATRHMRASEARTAQRDTSKLGRNYWRPSATFGEQPPLIDPGGVHAYARRHR